ncbi:MAG TPA: chromosomal replication initiator protein DnaA [Clostridiaceae bacterium]|nr:chromosomal replication initiator protein DnaA [Clostridiaceae bacterium]
MDNQLSSIWQRALELLKDEVTEISYNTWIKTITPVKMSGNTIELGAPADFNRGILESRYSTLIQEAIKKASNKAYDIHFVVASSQNGSHDTVDSRRNTYAYDSNSVVSVLNPKYTFDTFVIGSSNQLAHAAALAVAEAPAQAYNPLFIYGGVGLGKTHLMHAIGHYVLEHNKNIKVLYVSSEKFTNELINAIKDDKNEAFRAKYRNIDILLIDDIQFIAGKERTQEEFFHTFNALYESNKQIIISSDKPPRDIATLEDRLRSRFEWGLQADIQPPDFETRIAILKKKAQLENIEINDDVYAFIADNIASNIRELEGALIRVIAYSSLVKTEITLDLAKEALKDIIATNKAKIINANLIIDVVARHFNLKPEDFKSKKRNREVAFPRQIAMYLCRELTDMSLPQIGAEFGGRDHTTVMHAFAKITESINNNYEVRRTVEELKRNISG